MATEKIINTRIQLKYDTLANWNSNNPILKAGEVAIIAIASGNTQTVNSVTAPQCLMKVGDGTSHFSALPYISALAADVYTWAKKSESDFITWVNQQIQHPTIPDGFTISASATDDDVVVASLSGGKNSVTGTFSHAKKGPSAGFTGGAAAATADAYGESVTIKVPKLTVDAYGHVNSANDVDYVVAIPAAPAAPNDGILTLKAGSGLSATQRDFSANDADNVTFEVSHGAKPTTGNAHAATAGSGRTYVTKVDVDSYGHIAKVYTATETDQDLSNYKTKQSAVSDPTASGNATAFIDSITQNANGEIVVTKKNITAADLGLSGAMHFIGIKDSLPATGTSGDVVIVSGKEYVWDGDSWSELGDESSHALKSVTITGNNGLTGGGSLEANRTIGIADGGVTTAKIADDAVTVDKIGNDNLVNIANNWTVGADGSVTFKSESNPNQLADIYINGDGLTIADDGIGGTRYANTYIKSLYYGGSSQEEATYNFPHKDGTFALTSDVNAALEAAKEYADEIDTGVHNVSLASGTNNGTLKLTVDGVATDNIAVKGLGSAAYTASTAYATSAQGAKADTALQPAALNDYYTKTEANNAFMDATETGNAIDAKIDALKLATTYEPIGAETRAKNYADSLAGNYATTAQGAKADSALQSITTTANGGLKVTNKNKIDIDTSVVFVFNCGSASELVD